MGERVLSVALYFTSYVMHFFVSPLVPFLYIIDILMLEVVDGRPLFTHELQELGSTPFQVSHSTLVVHLLTAWFRCIPPSTRQFQEAITPLRMMTTVRPK